MRSFYIYRTRPGAGESNCATYRHRTYRCINFPEVSLSPASANDFSPELSKKSLAQRDDNVSDIT